MIPSRSIVARSIAGLLGSFVLVFAPLSAHAIPVYETNSLLVGGVLSTSGAASVSAGNETTQTLILQILNGLAWTVAKTAVQSLTQSMVNWINSGFEGSPAFVTDLQENLGFLADAVAEDFISGLDQVAIDSAGFSVRSPFQDQLAEALREEFYRTTSSYGFDIRNPYTLTAECQNAEGFTRGDFSCGYDGWFSMSQNPANNPIGRYLIARNELFRRVDDEAQRRITELTWGRGFLSWRGNCGPYARPRSGGSTAGPAGAASRAGAPGGFGAATVSLSQTDTSSRCRIRTPGAIIEESLGITVNSPLRQLEIADSINEVVGALAGQLVNQVLGGTGLSGLSQPPAGGGRSFLDRASDPSLYNQAATGSAGAIINELEEAESRGVQLRASNRTVIQKLDEAIRRCSMRPDIVRELEDMKDVREGVERAYATFLPTIPQLRTRITAVQQNANSTPADIGRLVDEYQRMISNPAYPRDLSGLNQDRGIIATIDRNAAEDCR